MKIYLKQIKSYRDILPVFATFLTKHPRYFPKIEWSSNLWTHNIFRAFELLFGRAYGKNGVGDTIRLEMSTSAVWDEFGNATITYAAHTFEAVIVLFEQYIREAFRELLSFRIHIPIRIYIPMLSTPPGVPVFASPYLFAIAYDASSTGSAASGTSVSLTQTSTGSNRAFIVGVMQIHDGVDRLTSITYDGGADFKANVIFNYDRTSNRRLAMYYLVNPPTTAGATVTANFNASISAGIIISGTSFTGVDQTTPLNGTATKQDNASSTTATASLTTSIDNCWLVSMGYFNDGTPATAGTNTVKRTSSTYRNSFYDIYDSNGAQTPAGAYSQTINVSPATFNSILVAAIAPAAVASGNSNFFALM